MPFTKSYRRKRRTFRKRRTMGGPLTMRRRPRPMTTGRVKKIIGAELKVLQVDSRDTVVNAANPFILKISAMAAGDAPNEREGNRITSVNLHGHVTLVGDSAGATDTTDVRIACFRWNEDVSTAPPTAPEIMQDVANLGSSYNIVNRGKFKILWSRYFTLVNDITNPSFRRTLRYYIKLTGPKILFDGVTANDADLKKFHIYFMVLSDSADAGSPTATTNTTFRYTDS